MSALSLILGKPQFRTAIGVLRLDAASNIQHNATAQPTTNPIEARSGDPLDNFTDHVRLNNRILQIDGLMSESPLTIFGSAFNVLTGSASNLVRDAAGGGALGGFAQQALAAGVGSIAGLILNRSEDDVRYPAKAFEYLIELRDNRVPFQIQTRLQTYNDMILTSLSVPQNAASGRSLRFSATFEQIRIVLTSETEIPESNTRNPSSAAKQLLGKKPQNEAEGEGEEGSTSSVAKRITDDFGWTSRGSGI